VPRKTDMASEARIRMAVCSENYQTELRHPDAGSTVGQIPGPPHCTQAQELGAGDDYIAESSASRRACRRSL
jgi:hypothetical protein